MIAKEIIWAAQASHRKFYPKGPFTSVTLAQWALESAWGKLVSGRYNFFGIKANQEQITAGKFTNRWTSEEINGKYRKEIQPFANYDTVEEGFDAHARLLCSPHYIDCQKAQTPEEYCEALQKDSYATARNYAATLINIIHSNNLKQYDEVVK